MTTYGVGTPVPQRKVREEAHGSHSRTQGSGGTLSEVSRHFTPTILLSGTEYRNNPNSLR